MLRFPLAVSAVALLLATPVFAQNSMSGPNNAMSAAPMQSMTCDQMMTKAKSMNAPSAAAMTMAKKQMKMAQAAMDKNDEAGCKMHMMNVMHIMR